MRSPPGQGHDLPKRRTGGFGVGHAARGLCDDADQKGACNGWHRLWEVNNGGGTCTAQTWIVATLAEGPGRIPMISLPACQVSRVGPITRLHTHCGGQYNFPGHGWRVTSTLQKPVSHQSLPGGGGVDTLETFVKLTINVKKRRDRPGCRFVPKMGASLQNSPSAIMPARLYFRVQCRPAV